MLVDLAIVAVLAPVLEKSRASAAMLPLSLLEVLLLLLLLPLLLWPFPSLLMLLRCRSSAAFVIVPAMLPLMVLAIVGHNGGFLLNIISTVTMVTFVIRNALFCCHRAVIVPGLFAFTSMTAATVVFVIVVTWVPVIYYLSRYHHHSHNYSWP